MRVYHPICEIRMAKGAKFVYEHLPLDSLLLNDKGHKIRLYAFTTLLLVPE